MLLTVSAGLCLLMLVAHSVYFRPPRATKLFFLLCTPVAALYGGKNFYVFNMPGLQIKSVPIVHVIGFLFAFYCALTVSIHIFEDREGRGRVPFFRLLCSTVFITGFIGLAIEYSNMVIGWWSWQFKTHFLLFFGAWTWRPLLIFPLLLHFFIADEKGIGRIKFYCILWAVVYFAYALMVDRVVILRWLCFFFYGFLLFSARWERPVVSLELLQFSRPVPPRERGKPPVIE